MFKAVCSGSPTAYFRQNKSNDAGRTLRPTDLVRFEEGKARTLQIPGFWNEIAQDAAAACGSTLDARFTVHHARGGRDRNRRPHRDAYPRDR